MNTTVKIRQAFDQGEGVLRLAPVFVPRRFSKPGRRLRLHPDDYYALGTTRGAIKERWFSSVIPAMNGPAAPPDEGMSYVDPNGNVEDRFQFKDAVTELGAEIIGRELEERFGTWPMYSKFFDYEAPLFLHLHLRDEDAARVGRIGKPEAYYFPVQLNNHCGQFPHTYFGFDSDIAKSEVRARLLAYERGDNRITELSRAYRIELGTGWYTPPGVVHAPGSYLTYEPQWNSDVNSVYENVVDGEVYPYEFLVENCPEDRKHDIDYVMSLLDWEANVDPNYRKHYFRPPILATEDDDHVERWVVYATGYIAAKETSILPGRSVILKDKAAYGCILTQGHGSFGAYDAEAAIMLRYGGPSADEYFVGYEAAAAGVTVKNESKIEPLVLLQHFGPDNPDVPGEIANE